MRSYDRRKVRNTGERRNIGEYWGTEEYRGISGAQEYRGISRNGSSRHFRLEHTERLANEF